MILSSLKSFISKKFYIVGIFCNDQTDIFNDDSLKYIKWIKFPGYKKNWLADPFILSVTDTEIVFFAEQMDSVKKKGKLVKVIVDRSNYTVNSISDILELDTHLSFPIIFTDGDDVYVYPENYQSGSLKIYKYNYQESRLENPVELISEPLVDTQILKYDNKYFAFGTKNITGELDDTRILYIYKSDTLLGEYKLFQIINNNLKRERGAGQIYDSREHIVRPVQGCDNAYGECIYFNELIYKDDKFIQNCISSVKATKHYPEGIHTYNTYGNISIIDSYGFVYGKIWSYIKNILYAIRY